MRLSSITDALRRRFIGTALVLLAAGSWSQSLVDSQNVLYHNRDWVPYSVAFDRMLIGNFDFLFGRHFVSGGALTANVFGRRLRIVTKKPWNPDAISFTARIKKNGYITIFTTTDGMVFRALRLGRNPIFPSQSFVFDVHEKHSDVRPLSLALPDSETVTVELRRGSGMVQLYLNGALAARIPLEFSAGFIGLETTPDSALRDPVILESGLRQHLPFLREAVSPGMLAVHGVFFFLIALFFPRKVLTFLALAGALWLSYDRLSYSRKSLVWDHRHFRWTPAASDVFGGEHFRWKFFESYYRLLGGTITTKETAEKKYGVPPGTSTFRWIRNGLVYLPEKSASFPATDTLTNRILIIGGSMDTGIGTSASEEMYDVKLQRILSRAVGPGRVEIINASRELPFVEPGDNTTLLSIVDRVKPQSVLLDVHFNYVAPEVLSEFLKLLRTRRVKIIYSRPPFDVTSFGEQNLAAVSAYLSHSPGSATIPGVKYYLLDRQLGAFLREERLLFIENNRPFTSPAAYLRATLFWDFVHLTDAGNDVLAEELAEQILRLHILK